MPRVTLIELSVKALKPPLHGQVTYWDKTLPGFNVRVSQGGSKSFTVVCGDRRERITIGRYPIISLADDRGEAKRILAERTLGKNRPRSIAFEEALKAFLEEKE